MESYLSTLPPFTPAGRKSSSPELFAQPQLRIGPDAIPCGVYTRRIHGPIIYNLLLTRN